MTTGGLSARYSNAQSGVVNYTTRSGGSEFQGSVSLMTDRFAPENWRTYFNRGELGFIHDAASHYTLYDRFFCSILASTWPVVPRSVPRV